MGRGHPAPAIPDQLWFKRGPNAAWPQANGIRGREMAKQRRKAGNAQQPRDGALRAAPNPATGIRQLPAGY